MVASALSSRLYQETLQRVSVTMEHAELLTPDSQYTNIYYFLQSLRNICGASENDTDNYDISNMSLYADGENTTGLQIRCFGSVTFRTPSFQSLTYNFEEFAPYTISGGTTTYDAGTKMNTTLKALTIYNSNWVLTDANFVITVRSVVVE